MKWILILISIVLFYNEARSDEPDASWLVVYRSAKGEIIYQGEGQVFKSMEAVVAYLMERRVALSEYPSMRCIFEPSCTLHDFSNVRGWLGKLGLSDEKYYMTDSNRRSMVEFGMIGTQKAFPSATGGKAPR
jgi:hypothetical protein